MKTETEEKGNKVQMEQIENTTQINDRFKPKCYIHNIFFFYCCMATTNVAA